MWGIPPQRPHPGGSPPPSPTRGPPPQKSAASGVPTRSSPPPTALNPRFPRGVSHPITPPSPHLLLSGRPIEAQRGAPQPGPAPPAALRDGGALTARTAHLLGLGGGGWIGGRRSAPPPDPAAPAPPRSPHSSAPGGPWPQLRGPSRTAGTAPSEGHCGAALRTPPPTTAPPSPPPPLRNTGTRGWSPAAPRSAPRRVLPPPPPIPTLSTGVRCPPRTARVGAELAGPPRHVGTARGGNGVGVWQVGGPQRGALRGGGGAGG